MYYIYSKAFCKSDGIFLKASIDNYMVFKKNKRMIDIKETDKTELKNLKYRASLKTRGTNLQKLRNRLNY